MSGRRLDLLMSRRAIAVASGARRRGVAAAVAFHATGVGVVLACVPGAGTATLGGLVVTSAGFTLWCFIGLLALPSLSRHAVLELDRMWLQHAGDRSELEDMIRLLDQDQEDELSRPSWVERIFYTVPSPAVRIESLRRPRSESTVPILYRVARTVLFISWAGMSWLPRAVHWVS